jgi:hypothetical protein
MGARPDADHVRPPADTGPRIAPGQRLARAPQRERTSGFASPGWARPLPEGLTWHSLIGNPIVPRTWAAWPADSRQREVAALIAALELTP